MSNFSFTNVVMNAVVSLSGIEISGAKSQSNSENVNLCKGEVEAKKFK